MSLPDGNEGEMNVFRRLGDLEIEELLSGSAHADGEGLDDLNALLGELRAAGSLESVADTLVDRHVALAAEAARMSAGALPTVGQPHRPVPRLRVRRRKLVLGTLLSSIVGKVVVGSVALAAATGGAAAAGVLPDPAQQAIADVASHIGIDLPSPADHTDGVLDEAAETAQAHCDDTHPEEAADCDVLDQVFTNDPTAIRGDEGAAFGEGVAGAAGGSADAAKDVGGTDDDPTGYGPPEGVTTGKP
jgi:hypothetical protein